LELLGSLKPGNINSKLFIDSGVKVGRLTVTQPQPIVVDFPSKGVRLKDSLPLLKMRKLTRKFPKYLLVLNLAKT